MRKMKRFENDEIWKWIRSVYEVAAQGGPEGKSPRPRVGRELPMKVSTAKSGIINL